MERYYLCFGGADLAGAFSTDLEPDILFTTMQDAQYHAEEMCIEAHESYRSDDDEDDWEPEYSDCFVRVVNTKDLNNWDLWKRFKEMVETNEHDWEEIKQEYGLDNEM